MLEQQSDQRSNLSCDKSSSPVFSQTGPWKCCWLPWFNLIQTLLVGGQRDGVRPCLQCQGWVWSSETSFFRQKCYWKINQVRSFMAHFLGFKTPLIGIGCPGLSGNLNKYKQFNNMGSFQQLFLGSKILLLSFVRNSWDTFWDHF